MDKVIRDETPLEFFREQLLKAMEHQKISTSTFTEYYLVKLLAGCVNGDPLPQPDAGYEEMPLALMYVRALQASRHQRARILRMLGDSALFVSGFFADSLGRKLVDVGYYRHMGGNAYARLSQEEPLMEFGSEVFAELSLRFVQFADLLAEVSEATRVTGNQSLLALYERWVHTRSQRAAKLLAERGIVPVDPGEIGLQ
jgi:hypothetical protein